MNNITAEIRLALHSIWMRRWLALGVAWAICLLGWLVVSMIPNRYESKAKIYVQLQSPLPDETGASIADRQQNINRVSETLTSTVSLKKVILGTDLRNLTSSDQDVLDQAAALKKSIKINVLSDNLFEISASSSRSGLSNAQNAKLSSAIVQKLIDLFVEENTGGDRSELGESMRFLDKQLAEREKALKGLEDQRSQFEQKYGTILPGVGSIEQRLAAVQAELSQVNAQYVEAQSGLSSINALMASTPPSITTPGTSTFIPGTAAGGVGPAHAQVAQLQGQIAAGHARGWTDNYPDMQALRSQLAAARAEAAREPSGGGGSAGGMHTTPGVSSPNPNYLSLRATQAEKQAAVAAAGARKAQLESSLNQFHALQASQPDATGELSRINSQYDVLKQEFDKLATSREQVRLRMSVQTTTNPVKFRVIDPPENPRSPAAPNRPILLIGVLVAGLLGGIAAAFARSKLQTTYSTVNQLAKASGMTVIGSVTRVLSTQQKELEAKRLKWFRGGLAALGGVFVLLLAIEFLERSMVA